MWQPLRVLFVPGAVFLSSAQMFGTFRKKLLFFKKKCQKTCTNKILFVILCIENNKPLKTNKMKRITPKVSRENAIKIAMNHNCVSREIAERYTDSELKEVLHQLKLKANF